jgi:hypothetical protein
VFTTIKRGGRITIRNVYNFEIRVKVKKGGVLMIQNVYNKRLRKGWEGFIIFHA